jgi:glycosyltransferase involved in cell wall biosynthesis
MVEPLISVALCTYNGERYLPGQLDSLLAQTHRNIEIVAVDDCSSDSSRAILEEYARRDARLRVHANAANLGFRRNFERAVSLCGGEYIALSDQDDVWAPEKLTALLELIGAHALAYCDSALIDEEGRDLNVAMSDMLTMVSTDDPAVFANANCVSGHASLFRRELVARALPAPECFFHDWWLAAVAASSGGVVYCNRKLVFYRYHAANVTDVFCERAPQRERGYRWKELHEFRERVEQLARLPGPSKAFLERLRDLWAAREEQWLSPGLAWFLWRHRRRLYALRWSRRPSLRHFMRYAPGLRMKRLSDPHAYAPPS